MVCLKVLSLALAAFVAVDARAVFHNKGSKADIVADSYIVVLKDGVSTEDFNAHVAWVSNTHDANKIKRGGNTMGMQRKYEINNWKGYNGFFDEETLEEILNNPKVKYVEHDRTVTVDAWATQPNAPSWGLGRISSKQPGKTSYVYDDSAGAGITIYGVDTGIDINHPEFRGRIVWGTNKIDSDNRDGHGHGTHTAGTFAGATYGVAKKANIVAVKVLDSQSRGTMSSIMDGISWCVTDARSKNILGKAAMNLSLGGGFTQAVNDAAAQAQSAGILVVAAAGNDNKNAQGYSPASTPSICTVASSANGDSKSSFSNWGAVIDIYAPGSNIISARPGSGSQSMSGTSMAAPHVAGAGAVLMSQEGITAAQACDRIKALGNAVIRSPGSGTTNKLLYNGAEQ
ncbi:Subtilisin-like protease 3 [Myotisia sp. PD_48]|nr:Subtilisin-like protease 3 [Myotisia sp. PD_48]